MAVYGDASTGTSKVIDLPLYEAVRDQMRIGDAILWHSTKILGRLIQHFSHAYMNHASLVLPLYGRREKRVFITEALDSGIVPNFLSVSLDQYEGEAYWYPLVDEWEAERDAIEDRAFKYIGVPYDYRDMLKNAAEHTEMNTDKLFCSEYVFACYGFSGIDAPTPGDLAKMAMFKDPVRLI